MKNGVAQWKRVGPIIRRSEDRTLLPLSKNKEQRTRIKEQETNTQNSKQQSHKIIIHIYDAELANKTG